MNSLWENIKKGVSEFYASAAERTDELAKVGVRKFDIVGIRRNIGHEMAELGGRVYHMIVEEKNKDVADDSDVKKSVKSIKRLAALLKDKEDEIEEIQKTARGKKASKPE
ncbi:MAG: hypothetical protein AMJ46_08230 [Latescibacteria bacterium DG_63]|nr:MAG: hypothetical protein AMJ46_08230 [Latescibacteria bacterium DG_63]